MSEQKAKPWNLIIGAAVVLALFGAWFLLPVDDWLKDFSQWIDGLGVWGYLLFVGVYILACLILAPATPLTIAAGLVFGLAWGFVVVVIGATLGAALAFVVARYIVRDKVKGLMEKKPVFGALDKAISENGWKVVLMLRLSPLVPFNLQNYFFGVTEVKFWHFAAATFVGIMPGCLLYLYVGAAGSALSGGKWGTPQWIFFGAGLVATLVVAFFVGKKAKEKLKEACVEGGSKKDSGKTTSSGATAHRR